MPRISKAEKLATAKNAIQGLTLHFAEGERHELAGKKYTRRQLIAVFRAHIDALRELEAARIKHTVAVSKERAIAKEASTMTTRLKLKVQSHFGPQLDVLAAFGWEPPKMPGPKTVAAKLEGAAKGRATRKAKKKK